MALRGFPTLCTALYNASILGRTALRAVEHFH
jgi:hypothetical protein